VCNKASITVYITINQLQPLCKTGGEYLITTIIEMANAKNFINYIHFDETNIRLSAERTAAIAAKVNVNSAP
jgi:hypothetical protein